MKKHSNTILTAVSLIALISGVSCNKVEELDSSTIRFGVSTIYENGPATKTEYSGKDQTNSSISSTSTAERIDWLSTDKIRILCNQASVTGSSDKFADYAITPGEASSTAAQHGATISPLNGNGLKWGTGTHNFYAFYPSYVQNSAATIDDLGTLATVYGIIPTTQTATKSGRIFKPDMNYAYMYAVTPNVAAGTDVTLNFKPLVTTLEFTLLTKAGDPITSKLTSVKLSSSQTSGYLAGNFHITLLSGGGFTPMSTDGFTNGSNEITITLPDGGVQLSTDPAEAYTVTFLTLPMDQTELTLTLGFADSSKRTLELKDNGNWITVEACKKTYIWKLDAPLTTTTYSIASAIADITQSGSGVTAGLNQNITVGVSKNAGGTVTTEGAWKAYFYTSAPAVGDAVSPSWSETPLKDGADNDWLTLSSYTGDGTGNTVNVTFTGAALSGVTMNPGTAAQNMITILRSGAGVTDLDLSTYNILDGSTTGAAETANCYVIKKYGSYLIPCVYGNAYSGGAVNQEAYERFTLGGTKPLWYFINADGKEINNAVITSDSRLSKSSNLSARVLWQDVKPGFEMITDANLEYVSTPGTAVNCPYIRVTFPQDKIVPGNVVIALYDETNTKILWSWHLWVTTETLTTVNVLQSDNTTSRDFLNVNLGWTPPINYAGGSTSAREQYVIIVCTVSGKVIDSFRVRQAQYNGSASNYTQYANTFYQWGRKDPFLPAAGIPNNASNKPISYNTDIITPVTSSNTSIEYGTAAGSRDEDKLGWMIKNPYIFNTGYPVEYYNLWNMRQGTTLSLSLTTKTVYDPSPRGFKMPNMKDFTGFTSNGESQSSGKYGEWVSATGEMPAGYNFSTTHSGSNFTFFFPAMGSRSRYNSQLAGNSSYGYYSSATPYRNGTSTTSYYYYRRLYFYSTSVNPQSYEMRTEGVSVRPVRDFPPASGANTGGQGKDGFVGDASGYTWE